MRYGTIYKIINQKTNKIYVGQTLLDLNARLNLHYEKVKDGRKSKLYNAMREYNRSDIMILPIETNIPINKLNEKEMYYIQKFNAIEDGYNTANNSNGRTIYSDIDADEILNKVKEGFTNKEIAVQMGVSSVTIQRLLISMGVKRYDKIDDEELKELWHNCLNRDLADYYGVDERTIRRHATKIGLPKKPNRPDYKNLKRLSKSQ